TPMSKWVYLQRKLPRTWRRVAVVVVFVNVLLLVAHNAFFTFHAVTGQPRVLGYYCDSFKRCGGWADRQKGIVNAYVMAAILGLEFKIYMPVPCDLSFFLGPRDEDWRLEPGELDSGSVTWFPLTSYERQSEFAKEFAASKDPLELFSGTQYILITTNVELVQFLRQNRLASRLKWLVELSLPEIYREVLARLFVPMPGPQLVLDVFRDSQPPGTKLVCAQPYNNTRTYRIMFTSDSPAMLEAARRNYSEVSIQINGPVTHVDRSMGVDACGGFGHAITEQLALSACHVLVISESGMGKIAAFMRNTDTDLYIYHDGVVEKFRRNMSFPNRIHW
ncbi:hypothetical protein BaRGS_00023129, partial [Batillaria attramentaria]